MVGCWSCVDLDLYLPMRAIRANKLIVLLHPPPSDSTGYEPQTIPIDLAVGMGR